MVLTQLYTPEAMLFIPVLLLSQCRGKRKRDRNKDKDKEIKRNRERETETDRLKQSVIHIHRIYTEI